MKHRVIRLNAPASLGIKAATPYEVDQALQAALVGPNKTAESRRAAGEVVAAASKELTRQIQLSSQSLFTPGTEAAAAITFGDADREMVDLRWARLFRLLDRRGAKTRSFKITDTYNAVSFAVYKEGERIETKIVQADGNFFEVDVLAGGFKYGQFAARWTDDWDPREGVAAMLVRWAKKQSDLAYAVLTAAGALTQTYDPGSATGVLAKDIGTINASIEKVMNGIYTETDPDGAQTEEELSEMSQFFCLFNPSGGLRDRVQAIQRANLLAANDNISTAQLTNPVEFISSRKVTADKFIVVYPGRKNVFAPAVDLQTFEQLDPTIAGVAAQNIGQGAYKHVRADAKQVCIGNAS